MSEKICNWHDMKQPVVYDREPGQCSVDKSVIFRPEIGQVLRSHKYVLPKFYTGTVQYRFLADGASNETVDMFTACHGVSSNYQFEERGALQALLYGQGGVESHHLGYLAYFIGNLKGSRVEEFKEKSEAFCRKSQRGSTAPDTSYTFGPQPFSADV